MNSEEQARWAVVTGASSGFGLDFSRQLAERGYNLVLVARRADRLETLVSEIGERYQQNALAVPLDLTEPNSVQMLLDALDSAAITPEVLINNAGFGLHGGFLESPWETERAMIELDVVAVVHLSRSIADRMVASGRGFILQVASIAAYQSSPSYAGYAAAKSYVLHYGEAIAEELRGTGVSCTVLSPGVARTEFLQVAGQEMTLFHRLTIMDSERVVRAGLRALFRRRLSVVPGLANKVGVWLNRITPRAAAVRIVRTLMGFSGGPYGNARVHDERSPAYAEDARAGDRDAAVAELRDQFQGYARTHPDEAETVSRFLSLLGEGSGAFYRDHPRAHFTASAVVLSPDRSNVLLTHHRKLDIWIQLGGHADGDPDLARAAKKEAVEESGLEQVTLASPKIVDIDIHPIPPHGGEPAHEHYDVRFLFIADPEAALTVSEESHDLAWVPVAEIGLYSRESSLLRAVEKARRVETQLRE